MEITEIKRPSVVTESTFTNSPEESELTQSQIDELEKQSILDVQTTEPSPPVTFSQNSCCSMEGSCVKCGIGVFVLGSLLIVILVPMSYSDLEYYEMGLVKNKATGSVDTSEVYYGGRHFIGVANTFKKFQRDVHTEDFKNFEIFNKEKIQVTMTCSLQYVLRDEDLALLHNTYDIAYKPILRTTALSAIKAKASEYSIEEYRAERPKVSLGLREAAATALGGICCRKDCVVNTCRTGCLNYTDCGKDDKGLFASLRNFQMQDITITKEQESRFLKRVVEQERKDTELYIQEETVTRKTTEELRLRKKNEAEEILQKGNANSTLIRSKAQAKAKAMVEKARNSGLQIIYSKLNITSVEQKNSVDYLRTLLNSGNAQLYVGFQYMVANGATSP